MPDRQDSTTPLDPPHPMAGETEFVHEEGAAADARAPLAQHERAGVGFGLLAYSSWGVVIPMYLWLLGTQWASVGAVELLAHRIAWGLPVMVLLLTYRRKWGALRSIIRSRRSFGLLFITTLLIGVNWFTFTFAVVNGHAAEVALGYFINPLVSIALGMAFLGERMRPVQWVCVAIAVAGVVMETIAIGRLPYMALLVAGTFGTYGLLRKRARADAEVGLAVELGLAWPIAVGALFYLTLRGEAEFVAAPWWITALLAFGGLLTVIPLLAFTEAARRLKLSTLGFLQYIAPSSQFLLAVLVFKEEFEPKRWIAFGLIWLALAIFSAESIRHYRARRSGSD